MSISNKVFWIFLSVVLMIVALGVSVYFYQHGNKRMHKTLHALLEFNENVYRLREMQLNISIDKNFVSVYDLQKEVASLNVSSEKLADSLSGFNNTKVDLTSIKADIGNYYTAINEYSEKLGANIKLHDELFILLEKIHYSVHELMSAHVDDYEEIELLLNTFLTSNDPVSIKKIKIKLGGLAEEHDHQVFQMVVSRFLDVIENFYINKLSLKESKDFLDLSSENFLKITSSISDELKMRDLRLDNILGFSATTISLLSVLMAILYWSFINTYVRRFLNNQAAVMQAIKSREMKNNIKPFSNDELGELTQRMWKIAAELYEKDEELRESEEKYRTYISTTPVAVIVFDNSKNVKEVNSGAEIMFGYSESELLNMRLEDLLAESDNGTLKEIFNMITDRGRHGFLLKMFTKTRKLIYANVSTTQIAEDRFVAFCQDITKRILLEEELKEMNENLIDQVQREVDKNLKQDQIIQQQKKLVDMGMMVSAIAHQWRQPLNALALCVQDVKEEFEEGNINKDYLEMFEENTMKLIMHMSKTIDDFRDFFIPDKELVNFIVVNELTDLIRLINVQIASRDIELQLECICSKGKIECDQKDGYIECINDESMVKGFPGEFKQVAINLIYNSVDSIEEKLANDFLAKGVIRISVLSGLDKITVSISDNGNGVPEDVAPHVFEPYYTTKPEGKGTGIGLYMSKVIIENHMNGRLYMQEAEEGACFVIELPTA